MLFSSLTHAINKALALDPESQQRMQALQGKIIAIEIMPLHFTVYCSFNNTGMELSKDNHLPVDVTIRGTPLQMFAVMLNKQDRQRFFAEDIHIEGSAETAQQVTNLFDQLQIDWEEQLSRVIGDAPAYHAARFLYKCKNILNDTAESVCANINEYIHEEANWLPTQEALQDFFADIDQLRMDVDRMEARINHILSATEDEVMQ